MRQLDAMLRQIEKRRHNEIVLQASFHGIKLPMKGEPSKPVEHSEAEVIAMDRAMQEAKLRKAQEMSRRYGK